MTILRNAVLVETSPIPDAKQSVFEIERHEWGIAFDYGRCILAEIDGVKVVGVVEVDEADVLSYLHASATHHLGPGKRYEIRRVVPSDFCRVAGSERGRKGLAWYRSTDMDSTKEPWMNYGTEEVYDSHIVVGRYLT